jgi:hypothetical protein
VVAGKSAGVTSRRVPRSGSQQTRYGVRKLTVQHLSLTHDGESFVFFHFGRVKIIQRDVPLNLSVWKISEII